MDAITLLKADHEDVEALFRRYEKAGDRAYATKRDLVDRIIEALSVHAAIEEQLFYPVSRATVPDTDDDVLEAIEEHQIVKWLLDDLASLDPADERFDAKVTVLIENVRHHVEEEEGDYFPKVREALGRKALADLGEAMAAARELAPTKPHPRSPSTPPGNVVVGLVAGAADRIGDTVEGVAFGGVTVVQDLVARALGRPRPTRVPRGSKVARTTARRVRDRAAETTDTVIASINEARDAGETTAEAARSGAKATATSAKKGARQTKTTAKRAATSTARASS